VAELNGLPDEMVTNVNVLGLEGAPKARAWVESDGVDNENKFVCASFFVVYLTICAELCKVSHYISDKKGILNLCLDPQGIPLIKWL
jgi:hypothetical protein